MADKKISALTASTTPLAGTEVLPIVQSGSTVKVAVSDLTAGRAVSALSITMPNTEGVTSYTGSGATIGRGTAFLAGQAELFTTGTRPLGIGASGAANLNFYTGSTRAFYVDTNQNFVVATAGKGIDFSANTHAAGMTSELLGWYEEGTFTPTDTSGAGLSLTINYAKYTRIGRAVFVNMFITYPSTASTAAAALGGLPFTVNAGSYPPLNIASDSGLAMTSFANTGTTTISIGLATNYATSVQNVSLAFKNILISGVYFV